MGTRKAGRNENENVRESEADQRLQNANLFKTPGFEGYAVAPAILSLRRPKQTVQLAMSRSKKVAKVIQKPGHHHCTSATSLSPRLGENARMRGAGNTYQAQ